MTFCIGALDDSVPWKIGIVDLTLSDVVSRDEECGFCVVLFEKV